MTRVRSNVHKAFKGMIFDKDIILRFKGAYKVDFYVYKECNDVFRYAHDKQARKRETLDGLMKVLDWNFKNLSLYDVVFRG